MKRKIMLAVAASVVALLPVMAQAENKLIVKDATGTKDKMVVTDSGWIGIGNNSPGAAIEINGLPGTVNSRMLMRTIGKSASGGGGVLSLHNNDPLTNGSMPLAGDRLGFYLFGTKNGLVNATGGGIMAMAEANWTANSSYPTYFTFITAAPGSTSQLERMRITAAGNIGIGTTLPKQKLEVNGGVRIYPVTASANTDTPSVPARPTCDASTRGTLWFTPSVSADILEICVKIDGVYSYKTVSMTP